jgi:serine/threonine-protein kinase
MESAARTTLATTAPGPVPGTAVRPARHGLVLAIGIVVGLVLTLQLVVQADLSAAFRDPLLRLATLAASLFGIATIGLGRTPHAGTPAWLVVAIGFEVTVALALSLVETSAPIAAGPVRGLSAVGPWVVFMCLLLHKRALWTLAGGLAAATMWPLAYAINAERLAFEPLSLERLMVWPAANYLMAILACLFVQRQAALGPAEEVSGLGSYRLLAPIGSGGMGEVWKATHRLLARRAAIKLVRPRAVASSRRQADQWVLRFQREANVIAGLQSPHTIYLYDFGVAPDGQFYYAMELLDGISLEALVGSFGPQPAERVRLILAGVCQSLDEAHQQGLVHRDLKPSNIMLCKLGLEYDFVKVLDFGLAKCASCEDVTQLTVEGTGLGTPGYIAPEIVLGEEAVDSRADLYSLGCVAYFLLTGEMVFPLANAMSMALRHVQETPVPPSQRTELAIPPDLERLVLDLLEKKPGDRPPSAAIVAERLEQCALPRWSRADAADWWQRHLPESSSLRAATHG